MDHDLDRKLRTITVYMFVVAICLGAPAGVNGPTIIVPFGIIPAFLSAVLGVIGLGGGMKKKGVAIPLDSIMIAIYLGLLVPTWVILSRVGGPSQGVMLATYATVPVIINLVVHCYCVTRHLPLHGTQHNDMCVNCQHENEARKYHFHAPSTIFPPSTIYTPDDEDEDDESRSQAPLHRDFDEASTARASSDIDGSTLWGGDVRHNHPPSNAFKGNTRQA